MLQCKRQNTEDCFAVLARIPRQFESDSCAARHRQGRVLSPKMRYRQNPDETVAFRTENHGLQFPVLSCASAELASVNAGSQRVRSKPSRHSVGLSAEVGVILGHFADDCSGCVGSRNEVDRENSGEIEVRRIIRRSERTVGAQSSREKVCFSRVFIKTLCARVFIFLKLTRARLRIPHFSERNRAFSKSLARLVTRCAGECAISSAQSRPEFHSIQRHSIDKRFTL